MLQLLSWDYSPEVYGAVLVDEIKMEGTPFPHDPHVVSARVEVDGLKNIC